MVSKIKALRDECLEKLKGKNDLEDFQNNISFEELNKTELKQFVKLCNNRIEYSKTFLNVIIWLMGIVFTILLILFSISFGKEVPLLVMLIIVSSIVLVTRLFIYPHYSHYISNIRGWTAFKEMALMHCPEKFKKQQ